MMFHNIWYALLPIIIGGSILLFWDWEMNEGAAAVKKEIKRVWFAIVISVILVLVFVDGIYESLPPIIQTVLAKTLLVTAGVSVAHILRKFLFEKVDWGNDNNWQHSLMVISFYIIIIYCFAMGG